MQLLEGDLFARLPDAAAGHAARRRGGALPLGPLPRAGRADGPADPSTLLRNVFFDTCVYHQPGIDLLTRVVPAANLLFASEMLGAVRGADPETGVEWDDTKRYVDAAGLTRADRRAVFEGNARRVFPRLDARLDDGGEVAVARLRLTFACGDYDRTRALARGHDPARRHRADLPAAAGRGDLLPDDAAPRVRGRGDVAVVVRASRCTATRAPFVALPVFTSRMFRHGGIYCSPTPASSGPEDLRGKVVGTPEYQLTAGVWIRGILADRHGVPVDSVRYVTGGQETPGRIEKAALDLGGRVDVAPIRAGPDAVGDARRGRDRRPVHARGSRRPSRPATRACAGSSPTRWRRRRQYFAATGIFPIMHVVVVRRDVYERAPAGSRSRSTRRCCWPSSRRWRASTTPRRCASCCPG